MKLFKNWKEARQRRWAKRREEKLLRNRLVELRMRLEILWDDLDGVDPESNTASIIKARIENITRMISELRGVKIHNAELTMRADEEVGEMTFMQ